MSRSMLFCVLVLLIALFGSARGSEAVAAGAPAIPRSAGLPAEDLALLFRVMERVQAEYVDPKTGHEVVLDAVRGLLRSLDRHSALIERVDEGSLREAFAGEFGGIGVELQLEATRLTVVRVFKDSPAAHAGIAKNDVITKIDGVPAASLTLPQSLAAIKGRPGTTVSLELRKPGGNVLALTLPRQMVRFRTVDITVIEHGIALAQISEFLDSTPYELLEGLEEASRAVKLRGVALDLRGNPGGVMESAVNVASLFLPLNRLVFSRVTRGDATSSPVMTVDPNIKSPLRADLLGIHLAVLIDAKSASASEIVASALQDHKRARVIGCGHSYGKGTIQSIVPLTASTSLKITTARYVTANGAAIESVGVTPDVVPKKDDCEKAVVAAATQVLRLSGSVAEAERSR